MASYPESPWNPKTFLSPLASAKMEFWTKPSDPKNIFFERKTIAIFTQ